jgi:hypothetical protein
MLWFGRKRKRVGKRIYFDEISISAREILVGAGYDPERELERADSLWVREEFRQYLPRLGRHQLINHLYEERQLVHKANLALLLQEYQRSCVPEGVTLDRVFQETYCLDRKDHVKAFLDARPHPPRRDDLWILKPGGLSRGEGVKILWNFDKIAKSFREGGKLARELVEERFVAQRYIPNPLLLDDRKSEIRIYWLVASVRPLMVLMFREGTARLNTLPFKLDDFDNPLVHVTNVYQQKQNPDYDPNLTLKWSWPRLQVYVAEQLKKSDRTFLESHLKPRLHDALRYVVRASLHRLMERPENGDFYALFGADFILDDELHPWLTEVQKNPGLSFDDPVKVAVVPPMLTEAVNIMHELHERRLNEEDYRNLRSVDGFEWVINEAQPELVGS